jgi:hypothetical protein
MIDQFLLHFRGMSSFGDALFEGFLHPNRCKYKNEVLLKSGNDTYSISYSGLIEDQASTDPKEAVFMLFAVGGMKGRHLTIIKNPGKEPYRQQNWRDVEIGEARLEISTWEDFVTDKGRGSAGGRISLILPPDKISQEREEYAGQNREEYTGKKALKEIQKYLPDICKGMNLGSL